MKIRVDKLDVLCSEYVRRKSNGYCARCLKYFGWQNLQACHFIGRSNKAVRYDESNLVALDFGCHIYFGGHPLEFVEWFKARLGEENFNLLQARARTPARYLDKKLIEIYLKEQLKTLER